MMNPLLYLGVCNYCLVLVVVTLVAVAPYRSKWHTVIDVLLFSAILHASMMALIFREGMLVAPVEVYGLRHTLFNPTAFASMSIIPLYGVVLLIRRILPWKSVREKVTMLARGVCKRVSAINEEDDPFPFRMVQEEKAPLINKV